MQYLFLRPHSLPLVKEKPRRLMHSYCSREREHDAMKGEVAVDAVIL